MTTTQRLTAHQWHTNGDHPEDDAWPGREGRLVRYYRQPDHPSTTPCPHCGHLLHHHGWIDSGGPGRIVCPGDFILTTRAGDHIPIPAEGFLALVQELAA